MKVTDEVKAGYLALRKKIFELYAPSGRMEASVIFYEKLEKVLDDQSSGEDRLGLRTLKKIFGKR